jgi:hypothetical protein
LIGARLAEISVPKSQFSVTVHINGENFRNRSRKTQMSF